MILNHATSFIREHAKTSFLVALSFLIVSGGLMRSSSLCLKTDVTPIAILDLEFAFEQERAILIRETWAGTLCDYSNGALAAQINIAWDFLFLVSYTFFFIVLIVLIIPATSQRLLISLAMMAGFLDCVENIFMYLFLNGKDFSSLMFAIPATIKFFLVFILVSTLLVRFTFILIKRI